MRKQNQINFLGLNFSVASKPFATKTGHSKEILQLPLNIMHLNSTLSNDQEN